MFGPDAQAGRTEWSPARAQVRFYPFRYTLPLQAERTSHWRVKIDDRTGAAAENMLKESELVAKYGEELTFTGDLIIETEEDKHHECLRLITKALQWSSSYGSEASIGYGQTVSVAINHNSAVEASASRSGERQQADSAATAEFWAKEKTSGNVAKPALATNGTRWQYRIRILDPFCIAEARTADNFFHGSEIIPGAAIKGCMAKALGLPDSSLNTAFDYLTVSHAFPSEPAEQGKTPPRPRAIPCSLAVGWRGNAGLVDLAGNAEPFADLKGWANGNQDSNKAVQFYRDWKDTQWEEARKLYGWPCYPARRTRVRTAIDSNRRRAADEQMFSINEIVPKELVWVGWLSLGTKPTLGQQDALKQKLLSLRGQVLRDLGRTKARFKIEFGDSAAATSDPCGRKREPLDSARGLDTSLNRRVDFIEDGTSPPPRRAKLRLYFRLLRCCTTRVLSLRALHQSICPRGAIQTSGRATRPHGAISPEAVWSFGGFTPNKRSSAVSISGDGSRMGAPTIPGC